MKSKAKLLEDRLFKLQSAIYDFQSELEDKASRTNSIDDKNKFLKAAEHAGNSAFELDVSQREMGKIWREL